jgi:NADPH2:quinone reductase
VNGLLEMLANVNLGSDLPIMAVHGRVVVIGSRGTVEIDPRHTMAKEVAILGELMFHATDEERAEAYSAIEKGLQDGSLNPVVAEKIPLADAAKAHHAIMESDHHGKIILVP